MRGANIGSASLHAGERGAKAMGLTLKVTAYTGKACTPLRICQVVRHGTLTPAFAGSSPASSAFLGVAQLEARVIWDHQATGSSPVAQTKERMKKGGMKMGICKNVKLASASIVKDEFGELYLRAEYTFETTDKDEKYRLVMPMIELPIPNNNLPNFRICGDDDPEIELLDRYLKLHSTCQNSAFSIYKVNEKKEVD